MGDYDLAVMKHWLISADLNALAGTLSSRREASPDGLASGQTTWYDYWGKTTSYNSEGTNSIPSTIAQVLPDGQTHYTYLEYNERIKPTLRVESYGDGSTSRTNTLYYYSNAIDLAYETGPTGELLRGYSYNAKHQVLTFTNAIGDVTTYHYDSQYRLDQRMLPTGLTNSYTYGADGFVSDVTDQPINRTRSFTYANSFVYKRTDERGLAVTNYWDNLQRLTGILYPDNTTVSNIYTILDRTAARDRLGNWTYSGYNAIRQKIAETNANNVITRYGYCDCGSLMYVTNAFGTALEEVTHFGYDLQGNRTFIFYPDGTTVTNWYDSLRRTIAAADGIGTRWFGYNNQGLLTSITNAAGVEQSTVFDIEDRVYSVTDANGVTVTNTYDNLGRLLTRTYPDCGAKKFTAIPQAEQLLAKENVGFQSGSVRQART